MLYIGDRPLKGRDIIDVARGQRSVHLADSAVEKIAASRRLLEEIAAEGRPIYGVNTGFGRMARTRIAPGELDELQINLIRSHAAGVGEPLPDAVVRAMLLLRANSLAQGFSGVRVELVDGFIRLLNAGIVPLVPSRGSVGASGDLAPLAHITMALIGEGAVRVDGEVLPATEALRRAGLEPINLKAKEGLAAINGTQAMTAVGVLTLWEAFRLWEVTLVAGALSTEAIKGSDVPFQPIFAEVRKHPGHAIAAGKLLAYMAGSEIRQSHVDCDRVQDPYSFRCQPQVLGAVRDALDFARDVLLREANSVTDNPLVNGHEIISGGNFHGQPVAMALDFLTNALVVLGNISERRTAAMMDASISGLPPFLAERPGLDSGLMIWQVTAAALASENKTSAMPASVDTIPTSANQEDFVSMGMGAALKAEQALVRSRQIVTIELLAAAAGLSQHQPLRTSAKLMPFYDVLDKASPRHGSDVCLQEAFRSVHSLVASGFGGLLEIDPW